MKDYMRQALVQATLEDLVFTSALIRSASQEVRQECRRVRELPQCTREKRRRVREEIKEAMLLRTMPQEIRSSAEPV